MMTTLQQAERHPASMTNVAVDPFGRHTCAEHCVGLFERRKFEAFQFEQIAHVEHRTIAGLISECMGPGLNELQHFLFDFFVCVAFHDLVQFLHKAFGGHLGMKGRTAIFDTRFKHQQTEHVHMQIRAVYLLFNAVQREFRPRRDNEIRLAKD